MLLLACCGGLPAALAAPQDNGLEPAIRKLLLEQAARAGLRKPQAEVRVLNAARLELRCPQPTVEAVDLRYPTRLRLAVSCPGAAGSRQELIARAEISAEVLVAAQSLPARHPLAAEDLNLERRNISTAPDALSEPADVAGKTLKRSLQPGQLLLRSMLATPQLVRRGETVRIIARSGPVEVSNSGEAMDNGHGDDVIRVRTARGRLIRARVIDRGSVEAVDLPVQTMPQSPE